MRFFLKNSAGFSMVQGLIVAGIVAGSSLVTTRLMNDQKKTQKTAEVKDKLEEFHQSLYATLQHKQNCKQTILANALQASIVTSAPVALNSIEAYDTGSARTVALVSQKYMNDTVMIKSMQLAAPISGKRELRISYQKISANNKQTGKRIYGGNAIDKTVTLMIQKNPTDNSFSSCYAITAAISGVGSSETGNNISEQMCNEMVTTLTGQKIFTWDPDRSICKPNAKCPDGQIYTGIDASGEVMCRNIKDWMDFNEVLDPTPVTCPINSRIGFVINNTTKKVSMSCGVCASTCDCPGSFDVCEFGTCVNRKFGCVNGSLSKGDASCMYKCVSGSWACPFPNVTCP